MKVRLMLTCLCDAFFGEVGIATVRVLEHAGCEVEFPERQTCCGQPPFNAGDWKSSRAIAEHCSTSMGLDDGMPIVVPSGSCAAMIREGYPMLFPDRPHPEHVYELAEFLVDKLLMTCWEGGSPEPRRIGFHRACHGRALGLKGEQEMLLSSIPGLELVPFAQPEQCCGFGGAFSATHGAISAGIGDEKLRNIVDAGITELVSGDMGCLMHLGGLAKKEGMPLRIRHYAEVLAETISLEAPV